MKAMSNVDIFAITHELNEFLEGARVDKSFQPRKDTVLIRFHKKGFGRVDLVFQSGIRAHKTEYPLNNPTIPPSFPMILRKKLKGAHVLSIKQHNFDRVIKLEVQKEQKYTLIIELFAKGNIILLDEEQTIIMPLKRKLWSDRDISSKRTYQFPQSNGINPIELSLNQLTQLFKDSEDDLIRALAKHGLGRIYSEEIVLRTSLNKNTKAKDLNDEEIAIVYEKMNELFAPLKNLKFEPNIILKKENSETNVNGTDDNKEEDETDVNDDDKDNDETDVNVIDDYKSGVNVIHDNKIDVNGGNDKEEDETDVNDDNNGDDNDKEDNNGSNTNEENNEKEEDKKLDVFPIELKSYEKYEKQYFKSFNEAADEFYSKKVINDIKISEESVWDKKVNKFASRLEKQEKTIEDFEKTTELSKKKGEILYSNYTAIEDLLNVINSAKGKGYSFKEIAKILKKSKKDGMQEAQIFESISIEGMIVLDVENVKINIDYKKSLAENAETYYEKGKKAKRKIKGGLVAVKNTKKQLKDMENKAEKGIGEIELPQKRVKKELKWFEKLRWFLSSDNHLIIGGRDANSNEEVVKKYLDNNDIYLHADIHGAPSTVIKKEDVEIDEITLKQAAIFASSFSSAWSNLYSSADAFWVYPSQVSKTPEHGEFLTKGSFIIRGKKNYLRGVNLKIAIGIVDYQGKRVMAGPVESLKSHTNNYVIITPGHVKKEAIAKDILHKINEDNLLSLDDVVRVLPSGKCDIVKEV